jgi:predicted dehydrogenase
MMRVGVIGVGYWGKKIVDEYIRMGEDIIVSDINKENLKFCEEKYDIKTMTDYKDILSDDRITAVNVCTPNATHFRHAVKIGLDFFSISKQPPYSPLRLV